MDSLNFNTSNFFGAMSMMRPNQITPIQVKNGEFDPHKLFLKNKEDNKPFGFQPENIPQYPEEELKELEEYCRKRGIIGINFGKMSPSSILNMLKEKNGIPSGKDNRKILHD